MIVHCQGRTFLPISSLNAANKYKNFLAAIGFDSTFNRFEIGVSVTLEVGEEFTQIRLKNPNDEDITVTFIATTANITDHRLIFNQENPVPINLTATLSDVEVISLPPVQNKSSEFLPIQESFDADQEITVPANASRKALIVQVLTAGKSVRVTDAAGAYLAVGKDIFPLQLETSSSVKIKNLDNANAIECIVSEIVYEE